MSAVLKPYLAITQIQLLGDLSLDDLVVKMQNTKQVAVDESVASSTTERQFGWDAFNQPGQTVLKLVIGSGTPLIILHGGAGDIAAFRAVQEQFSTPLWAVQPTPEAPLDSVDALAQFYFEKIKEARPGGPYRIAGFSASSMVTLCLAQLFEANEDEIVQLTFIDHFPMLFASSINGFTEAAETFAELLVYGQKAGVAMVADCCSRESAPARRTYGENLIAASQGRPSAANVVTSWEWIQKITEMNLRQIIDFAGGWGVWSSSLDAKARQAAARARVVEEIAKVQTPMSVLIANWGLRPVYGAEWNDLGVSLSERDISTVYFDAGHFDLFEKKEFSRNLEFDWVESTPEHELAEMV
jgi:thioesterase domain-containing protein